MNFFGLLRLALKAFGRHRLRALLTALGIVIGVGAFITMVALGRGASARIAAQIAAMGTNLLVVSGGSGSAGGARGYHGSSMSLTDDDAKAIAREVNTIKYVAPTVDTRVQAFWGGANWSTTALGTTPDYLSVRSWKVVKGVFFGQADIDQSNKVCVLGKVVVDELFGNEDPVGQSIRLRGVTCQVIGVLEAKGQSSFGQDYDDTVLMPITTVRRKLFRGSMAASNNVGRIYLSATSTAVTARAQEAVQSLLRQRHRTVEGDPEDPSVRDMTIYADMAKETGRTMTLLLSGIAAVSLIVGGIGIMNIMLVSVTERTREIGIRMAVGAKGRHVLMQFLLEALVLTLVGGLVGMAAGSGAAVILSRVMQWPTELGMESYAVGFGFSTAVGLTFGFYPAWRASRLDPIEALRYE